LPTPFMQTRKARDVGVAYNVRTQRAGQLRAGLAGKIER